MYKGDLSAIADEALAQHYPTPSAESQGAASFYNATDDDVPLDQIDPQLSAHHVDAMQSEQDGTVDDVAVTTAAAVQALAAAVSAANDDVSGAVDESYPESHLSALKTESQDHDHHSDVNAFVDTTHAEDQNNMYAVAALAHVQEAAAVHAESQDHQQEQQHHQQEHEQQHEQHEHEQHEQHEQHHQHQQEADQHQHQQHQQDRKSVV